MVQLPCAHHPGNVYSNATHTYVCYNHDVVKCYYTYNEIRMGYWIGSVGGTLTTSFCPIRCCKLVKKSIEEYFKLPTTVDGQCNDHRSGSVCL